MRECVVVAELDTVANGSMKQGLSGIMIVLIAYFPCFPGIVWKMLTQHWI